MHRRSAHQKALRRACHLYRNSLDPTPPTFAVDDPRILCLLSLAVKVSLVAVLQLSLDLTGDVIGRRAAQTRTSWTHSSASFLDIRLVAFTRQQQHTPNTIRRSPRASTAADSLSTSLESTVPPQGAHRHIVCRAAAMCDINQNFPSAPHHLHSRYSPIRNGTPARQHHHRHHRARTNPVAPVLSPASTMSGRKRKADDDVEDERMSQSPSNSPALSSRPPPRSMQKRMRSNISGRPLPLPRLLETLSPDDMRNLLQSICQRHPDIGNEVVTTAPRPSTQSTLEVLARYETAFRAAFPFGGSSSSDYAYNRVRSELTELLESLKDFTPHFLPPNEQQAATSLAFLDGATDVIHRLPNWDTYQHNRHKQEAYEEMAKAWAMVIREAAKKAGGMQLLYGGWDQKIAKHNEISGGKMQEAANELRGGLGWMAAETPATPAGGQADAMSIRQQLLSGSYGSSSASIGAW